jgi:cytosine/creatinine deaminase
MKLEKLWIPASVRGFESEADVFDVLIENQTVVSLLPSNTLADSRVKALASGALLPCFADLHVHIDKTFVVQDTGAADGDLFKAIGIMAEHRAQWSAAEIAGRMDRALQQAYANGTRALRTHLDWTEGKTPRALAVFEHLRDAWRGRIAMQCVSLTPLDMFDSDNAARGEAIALEVARVNQNSDHELGEAALLGAFVYRNARLHDKLQCVFNLASKNNLNLDFHVDEGLDMDARGLHAIAQLTIKNNMHGRVTCGHACSLAMQSAVDALATLALCAQAGIHLVALPSTNLYLQGAWGSTPMERGITRLSEADALSVSTSIATDNVADSFYPYGSYDLLETFGLGVQVAHLSPVDAWLASITSRPAAAMQLPWDGKIRPGCPADLVLLAARNRFELLSPAGRVRRVLRGGIFLTQQQLQ